MFGGNPGGKEVQVRMGDFWRLVLVRPSEAALERRCRFTIREGRFAELARRSPMDALGYLQTYIADCVDHGQPDEEQRFQDERHFSDSLLLTRQYTEMSRQLNDMSRGFSDSHRSNLSRNLRITERKLARLVGGPQMQEDSDSSRG